MDTGGGRHARKQWRKRLDRLALSEMFCVDLANTTAALARSGVQIARHTYYRLN